MDPSKKDLVARLAEAKAYGIKCFGKQYLTVEGFAHVLRVSSRTIRGYKHERILFPDWFKPDLVVPQNHRHLYTAEHAQRIYNKFYKTWLSR